MQGRIHLGIDLWKLLGDHRIGADVVVVKDIMKAPTIDNILHWVEIKFLDSKDPPNEKQMRTYSDFWEVALNLP